MASGGTQESKSQTTVDPEVSAMQKTLFDDGTGMLSGFLNNPTNAIAGFSPDQTAAFGLSRSLAQSGFSPDNTVAPVNASGTSITAPAMSAAQLSPDEIQKFMDPYIGGVMDQTDKSIMRNRDEQSAQIGATSAAGSPYGGSGAAVERSLLDRSMLDSLASTNAGLLNSGWNSASGLAAGNVSNRQQANQANAGYDLSAKLANATNGINAANTNNLLLNDAQARQLKAITGLLGTGQTQQTQGQNILNVPFNMLDKLSSITPKQVGTSTTSTAPNNTPNPLLQLGGTLLAGLLSDRNEKTNIQLVGIDPETGLDLYAYDYKHDVEEATREGRPMGPKRVGPMAQDVEAMFPGSTVRIGGNLVIREASYGA